VHSFVCRPADEADVVGRGEYGEPFASIVERGNVMGAQFHPEKSSRDGLALLHNFARLADRVLV
jgi:glutamine amidotransferase